MAILIDDRKPEKVTGDVAGGVNLQYPAMNGMRYFGGPILPHESPDVPRPRPDFSVANLN